MTESHPTLPTTPYGAAKLAGEAYVRAYHLSYGLGGVIVRPFNAYGPRCHHEGDSGEVIPKFLLRAHAGLPLHVFGDGEQTRDFTYVSDTARGILLAGSAPAAVGRTINLGSGREVSINTLARMIAPDTVVLHESERPGDVRRMVADSTLARDVLGYEPRIELEDGLARVAKWYEDSKASTEELLRQEVTQNWLRA
jgi:UDP-glucose 4-epimerase